MFQRPAEVVCTTSGGLRIRWVLPAHILNAYSVEGVTSPIKSCAYEHGICFVFDVLDCIPKLSHL